MDLDHRAIAVSTFNECWDLLEAGVGDADVAAALVACACTSRYHWGIAGGPRQAAIGDWMISRAAAAAAGVDRSTYGPLAWTFALAAEAAPVDGAEDWLVASMAEGVARAAQAIGDAEAFATWSAVAAARLEAIADPEDRAVIQAQFDELVAGA